MIPICYTFYEDLHLLLKQKETALHPFHFSPAMPTVTIVMK